MEVMNHVITVEVLAEIAEHAAQVLKSVISVFVTAPSHDLPTMNLVVNPSRTLGNTNASPFLICQQAEHSWGRVREIRARYHLEEWPREDNMSK